MRTIKIGIMEKLSNGILTIEVSSHGAELSSLKCGDTEYLWQADPAYWKRHSPVLFPIVGSLWNGKCRIGGKEFEMSQHGFARDMDFTLVSKTDNELWYRLVSDESTMRKYPFPFRNHNPISTAYTVDDLYGCGSFVCGMFVQARRYGRGKGTIDACC